MEAGDGAVLHSVSCTSPGSCTAVGCAGNSAVTLTEESGVWSTPEPHPLGTESILTSVSCPSAGNCAAVGYTDSSKEFQGLLLTESSGEWASSVEAGLPAGADSSPDVNLSSVSCGSAGNCTAVGTYTDTSGATQEVLLTDSSGVWATGVRASLPAGLGPGVQGGDRPTVSCPSAGDCTAVSTVDTIDGPCYPATEEPICSIAGQGLLLSQSSGVWAPGVQAGLPSGGESPQTLVTLPSVSCSSAGNCAAVGLYTPGTTACAPFLRCPGTGGGLLLTETSGVWAPGVKAAMPANSALDGGLTSVSCPSATDCTAVGFYLDNSGALQGDFLSAATASPAVSVSAPANLTVGGPISAASISAALTGGAAPIGTVTFTVFGPQPAPPASCASGGTPVGSASVSDNGSYHPSAGFTPTTPGDYWWYASYSGDPSDNPAASACGAAMAETVVAPTTSGQPPTTAPPATGATKPSAPALSAVKLGSKKFAAKKGTTLKLTVSQAARITVKIGQTVTGRKVKGVCKIHAKTGKRCTTTVTKRTLTLSARAGANTFKLKLRGLAKGAYTATISAQNANGKSRAITLEFTITHS